MLCGGSLDDARDIFQHVFDLEEGEGAKGATDEDNDEVQQPPTKRRKRCSIEVTLSSVPHCLRRTDLNSTRLFRTRADSGKESVLESVKHLRAVLTASVCRVQYM